MNAFKRTFGFIHRHPLAKRHLLRAYFRFFLWQIRSRLTANLIVLPFISGTKILARRKLVGMTGNIYAGLSDFNDMAFLLHFLLPGDVFFDVGANVGVYTILASGVCGAHTLSFEPAEEAYKILDKNIRLNQLQKKVKTVAAAVAAQTGELNITSGEDATNHIALQSPQSLVVKVESTCLDNYADENPILLKIDVEGYENEVLKGASKLLQDQQLKAIIIELIGSGNYYGFDETIIHQLLKDHGFLAFEYDAFQRNLTQTETMPPGNNYLYVRNVDFVKKRIQSARPFHVFNEKI